LGFSFVMVAEAQSCAIFPFLPIPITNKSLN